MTNQAQTLEEKLAEYSKIYEKSRLAIQNYRRYHKDARRLTRARANVFRTINR